MFNKQISSRVVSWLGRACLLIFVGLVAAAAVSSQPSNRRIARIEAEGLQTLSLENVITMSGLKTGENFSVNAIDAAAQRLLDSGLFNNVGYRTRTVGTSVTIVLQLDERRGNSSPVVFDNFIWFSDQELADAVKRVLPSFNGSVPDTGNSTEMIKQALQELLAARKLPGTVEYTLTETGHLFRVGGVPIRICTLHFPGAHDVSESKLIETMKSSTDVNYSRAAAIAFPQYGLFPLYRELGHLKATFGAPVAKPDTEPGCENGVDLTIPVNEGLVYQWAAAEWFDNKVLPASSLDATLGMKPGEIANGRKFDKGLREVEKAYGKSGHIQARFSPQSEFDDASQRVTYKIAVDEGPQYRMGTLEFKGVSEADAALLKEKWRLRAGDIYDTSYVDRFFREDAALVFDRIARARQAQQRPLPTIDTRPKPNRQTLTVDLIIEVKN